MAVLPVLVTSVMERSQRRREAPANIHAAAREQHNARLAAEECETTDAIVIYVLQCATGNCRLAAPRRSARVRGCLLPARRPWLSHQWMYHRCRGRPDLGG